MNKKITRPLAVFGAVLFLGTGSAVAATGGNFILGRSNSASSQTVLTNSGSGPVLALSTRSGQPPVAVSAQSGKATNLNSDKLDGLDSTAFALAGGKIGTVYGSSTFIDIDGDGIVDDVLAAKAQCPSGTKVTGGGHEVWTTYGAILSGQVGNGWLVMTLTNEGDDETDLTAEAQCYSPRGSVSGATEQFLRTTSVSKDLTPDQRAKVTGLLANRR